ncbi:MAG: DUF2147 domain-containing protein [Pseudomonadota bacterium]
MKYLLVLLSVLLVSNTANANQVYNPEGLWLTQNERSVIQVEKCGDELCGKIHWIIKGGMQTDTKNPNMSLRDQKICGLQIVSGLKQSSHDGNYWLDGKIYKADDGDTYNAKIQMLSNDEMTLRGYLALSLLGKSQTWKRVSAKDYPACK